MMTLDNVLYSYFPWSLVRIWLLTSTVCLKHSYTIFFFKFSYHFNTFSQWKRIHRLYTRLVSRKPNQILALCFQNNVSLVFWTPSIKKLRTRTAAVPEWWCPSSEFWWRTAHLSLSSQLTSPEEKKTKITTFNEGGKPDLSSDIVLMRMFQETQVGR